MVKHIVLWTLKDTAEGKTAHENALAMKSLLEALVGSIPGLLALEVGIDFSRGASSADVALYSEFADRDALGVYQVHPDHLAIADFVKRISSARMVADYEV